MTTETFLILWASTALGVLLVVQLSFPWAPVRRWLARAPELITDEGGREWIVRREGTVTAPQPSKAKALALGEVTLAERVKAWARDWNECPWCCGAWISAGLVAAASVGDEAVGWWWPVVWLAGSGTVVVLDAIAER